MIIIYILFSTAKATKKGKKCEEQEEQHKKMCSFFAAMWNEGENTEKYIYFICGWYIRVVSGGGCFSKETTTTE